MDRKGHDYAAAMAFAQQQQQQQAGMQQQQQQQFGFHPQPQQFPHQVHGAPPFLPPHPSMQQFPPYNPHLPPQQQLYPHHHALPHLQQQQAPHGFGPHPPPHHMSPGFLHPLDSAPPPALPPSDPELQKRIDKLVEYAAKNGPEFEAMIREKQQENPAYSFLFGGEGHNYYRYKLLLSTRPPGAAFSHPFPTSSMSMMPSSHNPMINPSAMHTPPLGGTAGPPGPMFGAPQMHQPYPPFFDQHQQLLHSQPYMGQGRADYELSTKSFKGLSGPLPSDVAAELSGVLTNLNGTKESIKGAKTWFMQRSPFAPALAEALRDRIFALDDSERQLHIIFLANDILFDSLQRRANPQDLDNEALAFKPVIGAMLSRIYNNPHNKDSNQSRLEKILQFWASKQVYDQETITNIEGEMTGGLPMRSTSEKDAITASDPSGFSGLPQAPQQWTDKQNAAVDQLEPDKRLHLNVLQPQFGHAGTPHLISNQPPAGIYPPVAQPFSGPLPTQPTVPLAGQPMIPHLHQNATATTADQTPPPYPLFPPGLIPGMVRKMQIGSGVPYSSMSPLDIPTVIPPSTVPHSEVLERVSKFFKEIGEVNPSEGPLRSSESHDEDYEYERDSPIRKGGACIPPPPNLQVDPESGTFADGSVGRKSGGSGRLGLGASADPNEVSQYDDVYSSYRKQRSTNYHSSMSARTAAR